MPDPSPVLFEARGPTAVISLNRPEKRNAVNPPLAKALREAVLRFLDDTALRVAVLTGTDRYFCAGMDLKAFAQGLGKEIFGGPGHFAGFVAQERNKPIIAAVEGPALAGGAELALACDLLVAGESAYFGFPEVTIGLFAAAGGAFRLCDALPRKKALEILLTGDPIPAQEAQNLGLINHIVPDGQALDKALNLAERIARNAPLSIAATLATTRPRENSSWKTSDAQWQTVLNSHDAQEGVTAFLEKRPPKWRGE